MKGKEIIVMSVAVLVLTSIPVMAQTATVVDDFETGSLSGDWSGFTGSHTVVQPSSIEGTYWLKSDDAGTIERSLGVSDPDSVEFYFNYSQTDGTFDHAWNLIDSTGDSYVDFGIKPSGAFRFYNGSTQYTTNVLAPNTNYKVEYFHNTNNNTYSFNLINESSGSIFHSEVGLDYKDGNPTNPLSTIEIIGAADAVVYTDYIGVNGVCAVNCDGGGTGETTLELEIDSWMPRDDSQAYTVLLNETNTTTGNSNITDVTADANVTIYNITNTTGFSEPIATVNNTTNTIKSYNQTGVVAVNATYNGNELNQSENLTVGPRNLSNIGIMPPEQWPCSFLGCDEAPGGGDNPHNIGSSMQWLWLIIVIMVAATRFAENPFVGVGTGIVFSILVWVLEYIDLGAVLITVFSGLLIGGLMARTQMGRGVTRDNERSGIQANKRNE